MKRILYIDDNVMEPITYGSSIAPAWNCVETPSEEEQKSARKEYEINYVIKAGLIEAGYWVGIASSLFHANFQKVEENYGALHAVITNVPHIGNSYYTASSILEKLKKNMPHIKVIAFSGMTRKSGKKLLEEGCVDYFVSKDELNEGLDNVIGILKEILEVKNEI